MAESFDQLRIWKQGYDLLLRIASMADSFPEFQRFGLTIQLYKSSNSIIANIAESQGRYAYADKVRVLYIARGELFETRSHLKVALGLGYISKSDYKLIDVDYEKLLISINGYINHLVTKKSDM